MLWCLEQLAAPAASADREWSKAAAEQHQQPRPAAVLKVPDRLMQAPVVHLAFI